MTTKRITTRASKLLKSGCTSPQLSSGPMEGYTALTAMSGAAALEILKTTTPDLITHVTHNKKISHPDCVGKAQTQILKSSFDASFKKRRICSG